MHPMGNRIYQDKNDEGNYGPAMLALNERQQTFVREWINSGGKDAPACARRAGYGTPTSTNNSMYVAGHRLAHDAKIQAALAEEAGRRLHTYGFMAIETVADIMQDQKAANKDRLKAAEMVMNRIGLHAKTENLETVVHVTTAEQIQQIRRLASRAGLDAKVLLESYGVIDAEFEEV